MRAKSCETDPYSASAGLWGQWLPSEGRAGALSTQSTLSPYPYDAIKISLRCYRSWTLMRGHTIILQPQATVCLLPGNLRDTHARTYARMCSTSLRCDPTTVYCHTLLPIRLGELLKAQPSANTLIPQPATWPARSMDARGVGGGREGGEREGAGALTTKITIILCLWGSTC